MRVADFDYELPEELIAQVPVEPRDRSRLMVVNRKSGEISHDYFFNLGKYLDKTDQLVFNNSKVFPARLRGTKASGGWVEVLLVKPWNWGGGQGNLNLADQDWGANRWEVMTRNLGRARQVIFGQGLSCEMLEGGEGGVWQVRFNLSGRKFWETVEKIGQTPLPPYIKESKSQTTDYLKNRYQTVYAKVLGSAAAPTAGLHFTNELIDRLVAGGIRLAEVTLHVGLGTFQPLVWDNIADNKLHSEYYSFDPAQLDWGHVVAVGTTTVRVLESWAKTGQASGETDIFIYPPYQFKAVDKLITNFHLPKSSLLMLVCAFGGFELITRAYREAVKEKYRFFSFGDAMMIV